MALKSVGPVSYLAVCAALVFARDVLPHDHVLAAVADDMFGNIAKLFWLLTLAAALYTLWAFRPGVRQFWAICLLLFACQCILIWLQTQLFPDPPELKTRSYYDEVKEMAHGFLLVFYALPYFAIWSLAYVAVQVTGLLKRAG